MTPLFGPGWGNYAIRGILEIEIPPAISLLPTTPGWWALLALASVALLRLAWRRWKHWQNNRYRREALAALAQLQARVEGGDTQALLELAPLLRATAIHATTRRDMASIRGEAWARELAKLSPDLPPLPVQHLQQLAYAPLETAHSADYLPLFSQLRGWIEAHRNAHA